MILLPGPSMAIEGMSDRWDERTMRLAAFFGSRRNVRALHVGGTDTDVYAVTSRNGKSTYVAQIYDGFGRVDQEMDHGRLVREYAGDMRIWSDIARSEPNPLHQEIRRGLRAWKIQYEVVPKDRYIEIDGVPCLITKRYFKDKNLRDLRYEAATKGHNGTVADYDEIEEGRANGSPI